MTKTVLILGGSGKIGRHSAQAFTAAGWNVRFYDRAKGNMKAAALGVDVIVNGLNPPAYHNWKAIIPAITRQVIEAAKASGATVIIPGNVYNFGNHPGIWDENTPQNSVSRKGRIRKEMEDAYRPSGVQTIVLRAGNFIDPDHNGDLMTLVYLKSIASGKVTYPGDPDTLQAYCFLPDWARAAAMLADKRDALGQFEDVPLGGLAFTAREMTVQLEQVLGRKLRLSGFPWLAMRLAAPFWELARELLEMRYLWNTDHQLSDRRLKALLPGFRATPTAAVIAAALPSDIRPDNAVPADIGVSAS